MLFRLCSVFSILLFWCSCTADSTLQDHAPTDPVDLTQIEEPTPQSVTITRAGNRSPYEVNGTTYTLLPSAEGYSETGIASWYGMKFHGNPTSNGEVFDAYQLTAAHKTLPLPCYARITNLENGHSIMVRINDRGPFVEGRLIDLSWAAAAKLEFVDQGLAEVRVDAILVE